eukprot:6490635-Amphidinium_carterae.1
MALRQKSHSREPAPKASLAPCSFFIGRCDDVLHSKRLTAQRSVSVSNLMDSAIPHMFDQRVRLELKGLLSIYGFR